MATPDSTQLGKQFLQELLGKLPEASRAQAASLFESAEAAPAVHYVGEHAAQLQDLTRRQSDLDTRRQQLDRWHQSLTTWVTQTERKFVEREAQIRTGGRAHEEDDGDHPPSLPGGRSNGATTGLTREEAQELMTSTLQRVEQPFIAYVADAVTYGTRHLQQFGEQLDVNAIVTHPKIQELGFQGVYALVHKDKIDAKAQKDAAAARQQIRDEVKAELLAQQPQDLPYPVGSGSPLDALSQTPEQRSAGGDAVARSVRLWNELQHQNR